MLEGDKWKQHLETETSRADIAQSLAAETQAALVQAQARLKEQEDLFQKVG